MRRVLIICGLLIGAFLCQHILYMHKCHKRLMRPLITKP